MMKPKIKKVKKFSTDGEHFYINKQPVCEKEFLEQSKNIREIDKIKDIIKSNKLQYPNPFGKYIQVKRYNEILLPKIENELIEMLLDTQSQPIKEDKKECKHKFVETYTGGKRCNKCNMSLTEFKYSTPSQQEESKDIDKLDLLDDKMRTVNPILEFVRYNSLAEKINEIIDSLTKRNIK